MLNANLPIHLNALELAVLRYYASASFDDAHNAPAHPAMVAGLVHRGLLRWSYTSFDTTALGEAAIAASPLTVDLDGARVALRVEGRKHPRYVFSVSVNGHPAGSTAFPYEREADPMTGDAYALRDIIRFCQGAVSSTAKAMAIHAQAR